MQVRPIPAIAMMSLALVSIPAYQKLEAHLEGNHHDESQSQTYGEETTHETAHHEEAHHEEAHKILVTSPLAKPVTITQQFVCQIHSHRHIEVCALESGYLEEIPVREGQAVKQGETMFRILPTLYDARLAAEKATGKIGAIEADFNNETGNIAFRADFPNSDGLLRHGQTGTVLLSRTTEAVVIPQRATFEILARKYAYVVSNDELASHPANNDSEQSSTDGTNYEVPRGIVRQREIVIQSEQDDIYLIKDGIGVNDRIILEGIRQVRDGDEVEYEFRDPEEVLSNLKYHAE